MPRLSIVMPFLNEGMEPLYTVRSILDTCGDPAQVEIIAVQDDPQFGVDFTGYPQVVHVRNPSRMGTGVSRNIGVTRATSGCVLIIDAHMRFRHDNWVEQICTAVEDEPTTIFCTRCAVLNDQHMDVENPRKYYYGANLLFVNQETPASAPQFFDGDLPKVVRNVIEPKWRTQEKYGTDSGREEIPCVLGACYAFRKSWFNHLRGFNGLMSWGTSEPFLSLKSWMAGGTSKLLPSVTIGHLFRGRSPFTTPIFHLIYNKLLVIRTVMPEWSFLETYLPSDKLMVAANQQYGFMWTQCLRDDVLHYRRTFVRSVTSYAEHFGIPVPGIP